MTIYLPIAEMSVNILLILGLGGITGILSGMFGVGGGFLMTPLLIFIGVPPAVSVSTVANQMIASSVSGFLAHWRRDNIDFKMGWYLLAGGIVGSTLGVALFRYLTQLGYIDLIISLLYVFFLGGIGVMMARDSLLHYLQPARRATLEEKPLLAERLPLKREFPKSKRTISLLMPSGIGLLVGVMVSLMGMGGGFLLIPAMIYLLGMPTNVVIGTSLFQIIFITANVTFLQAVTTHTVDIMLAFLLLLGSVVGAQFGTRFSVKIPAEKLRALMAALVLAVALKLAFGLFTKPADIYTVAVIE